MIEAKVLKVNTQEVSAAEFLLIKLAQITNAASSAAILLISHQPEEAMEAILVIDASIHEIKDFIEHLPDEEKPKVN